MTGILTHNTSSVSPIQRWCRAMEPSENHATWHHQLLIIEKTFELKCLLASLTCPPYIFTNPVFTNFFKKFDVFSFLHGRRNFRIRKGQLISTQDCRAITSPKKERWISTSKLEIQRLFFGRILARQFCFETNWPLEKKIRYEE